MDQLIFRKILKKYLEGQASEEEKRIIDLWYDKMGKDQPPSLNHKEELLLGNRYWNHVREYIKSSGTHPRVIGLRWYAVGVAAAALVFFISYLNLNYPKPRSPILSEEPANSLVVYKKIVNRGMEADQITLPDGSKVTLDPKTTIRYASAFDGPDRKIYLDGKAFFEVTPDKNRPFRVYTQKVITKVLGTSFTVMAYRRDKEVKVSVRSGKVSVYTKEEAKNANGTSGVILTPNQEFVYNKDKNKGSRGIVEKPLALLPAEEVKRMRFEDASPKLIFEAIEKVYGVDIVFDETRFSSCKITTSISDGNIFNRLHIICEVMSATYRIEEGKIVIEGDGCQSNI